MSESSSKKQKILIIDDNVNITKMFTKFFELKGFNSVIANDGKSGLSLLESNTFDAVILDISMPEFTGFDVIDELEKKNMLKQQKIIVLTATSLLKEKVDELNKKGVICLNKPIGVNELIKEIEK